MDRNQLTGLILMLVFITIYFQFFAPEPNPEQISQLNKSDSSQIIDDPQQSAISQPGTTVLSDSAKTRLSEMKFGLFSAAAEGEEKVTTIENEKMIVSFSSKGGVVNKIILKDFKDFRGDPLVLIDDAHAAQHIYVDHLSRKVDLSELYFTGRGKSNVTKAGDTTVLEYRLTLPEGQSVTYKYTIPGDGYEIGMTVVQNGLESIIGQQVSFAWNQRANRLEKDFKDARNRTTVKYRFTDGDVDELSATSTEKEEETIDLATNWVSFRQKFFTSAIISATPFTNGQVSSYTDFEDTTSVKNMAMTMTLPYADFIGNNSTFKFYYGPNNYAILKDVAPDFSENVDLGWSILSWINKFAIIPIFHFLEQYISNYGVIIIIMVIILRIVLAPLTYKSHMGMAKMRVMKPELDELKAKHGDDAQKAQQEQMALYQKVGINPLSGCIPMLLQMPILFAMFYFFPNSIELRQESFLWATDLSTYDSILDLPFVIPFYGDHVSLFTLLMTASTILYTWSNSQMTTVQGPMKSLQYIMPIMFLFFLNSYSSGLTFYYFVSNIVSFGQIALFRKFIDEDKIKKVLDENRKKNVNKKKSSFQQKLEEAMRAKDQKKKPGKK
ncbi:MAG: membrane protein insertase YidC [Marinoscillum sp.]|uniref:membrane protein insertase YidC n=1 Tax=Marinoscillum sp. TaxID=2024838 RepID=UPI0033008F7E